MSRGGGLLITMDAGCGTAARGLGGRDQCGAQVSIVRFGLPPMCPSSDSEAVLDLVSVLAGADGVASAGCPSGRVTASSRGGVDMVDASAS